MNKPLYPLVIPTIQEDIPNILGNIKTLFDYLPIKEIIFVGPENIIDAIPKSDKLHYINEDTLIDKLALKQIFNDLCKDYTKKDRWGWYLQQFIKIAFSLKCKDEYYLLWDSDTIPTKKLNFFDGEKKPFLDCKTEYHTPYFITLKKILPLCNKQIKESFISEHMIIKTQLMREMIRKIEYNSEIKGNSFMEKILYSIPQSEIGKSGFSEFETYGNFILKYFPEHYSLRKWHSLRWGAFYFKNGILSTWQFDWLARYYDAITFEKNQKISFFEKFTRHKHITFITPRILDFISVVPRLKSKFCRVMSN